MKRWFVQVLFIWLGMGVAMISFAPPTAGEELTVSAAASLTNAFGEIGKKFEAENPGVRVVLNFAASGVLLQQMERGAPVDVFASADQKTMDQAKEKGLILETTRRDFVRNRLVLIVPRDSRTPISKIGDLTQSAVTRVTLGNPETVPAGRYARDALTNEGLWESLKSKFIFAESVRQALDYVSRGEVDAGFVFSTDAAIAREKVQVAALLEKHQPILYPAAVVAGSQKREVAGRFLEFLRGSEAQAILSHFGFERP